MEKPSLIDYTHWNPGPEGLGREWLRRMVVSIIVPRDDSAEDG